MVSQESLFELLAEVSALRRNFSLLHSSVLVRLLLLPALPLHWLVHGMLWVLEKGAEYLLYGEESLDGYTLILRKVIVTIARLEKLQLETFQPVQVEGKAVDDRGYKEKPLGFVSRWILFEIVLMEVVISVGVWILIGYFLHGR